ncbi:MAG: FHA domain-containing protein [Planctomycetota bacterium]
MTELLVAKHDGQVAVRVPLDERRKLTIGRSHRCDLHLAARSISRRHALLFRHESEWHLVDTGSRTGIHRELERVAHVTLEEDRWVRIGPAYLWLRQNGTGATAPIRPAAWPSLPPADLGLEGELDGAPPPTGPRIVYADAAGSSLERFDLEGLDLVTVGRSPRCDLALNDQQVSRLHCVLYTEHRGWCVTDAGSDTGTRVEGRVTRRRVLVPERLIRIGGSLLWLERTSRELARDESGESRGLAITPDSAFFDDPDDRLQTGSPGDLGSPATPARGGPGPGSG